jgi:hypothetical protein
MQHVPNPPDPARSWRLPHRSNWQAARDIRTGERLISVPSHRTPPELKRSGGGFEKGMNSDAYELCTKMEQS